MKKILYSHLKPQNYYNHLLTFFIVIALTLTFSLVEFEIKSLELFFIKFFIILFLLLFISVLMEYFYKSEYMNPIEISKVESFTNIFLRKASSFKKYEKYFSKYDHKSKNNFKKIFKKNRWFFVSSIRKHKKIYEVTIINENRMLIFLLLRFFGKGGVHKIFLKYIKNDLKIVRLE